MEHVQHTLYDPFLAAANQIAGGAEILDTEPIYQRQMFVSARTTELLFFLEPFRHPMNGNMYIPGMLPNPQVFLIEQIQIEGVTSQLKPAACELVIGNKRYMQMPAWCLGLKNKGYKLKNKLFIGPMVCFQFRMTWAEPIYLGRGIDGAPLLYSPLTVVLHGQRARPLQ